MVLRCSLVSSLLLMNVALLVGCSLHRQRGQSMASQLLPAGFSEPDLSPNEANLGLTFKDSAAGDYPTQVSVGRLSRMLSADDTSQAADESTQIERKQANIIREVDTEEKGHPRRSGGGSGSSSDLWRSIEQLIDDIESAARAQSRYQANARAAQSARATQQRQAQQLGPVIDLLNVKEPWNTLDSAYLRQQQQQQQQQQPQSVSDLSIPSSLEENSANSNSNINNSASGNNNNSHGNTQQSRARLLGPSLGMLSGSSLGPQASLQLEQWQPNLAPIDTGTRLGPAKSRKSHTLAGATWPSGVSNNKAVIGPGSTVSANLPTPIYPVQLSGQRRSLGVGPSMVGARGITSAGIQQAYLADGGPISGSFGSQSSSATPLASGGQSSGHRHRLGTEEVALQTPMHSPSANDYEWKRVENSRWNNLRGMWGKRAISEKNGLFEDSF